MRVRRPSLVLAEEEEPKQRLCVVVPRSVHVRLKLRCVEKRIDMQDYVLALLRCAEKNGDIQDRVLALLEKDGIG